MKCPKCGRYRVRPFTKCPYCGFEIWSNNYREMLERIRKLEKGELG